METEDWNGNEGFNVIREGEVVARVQGYRPMDNRYKIYWGLYEFKGEDVSHEAFIFEHRTNLIAKVMEMLNESV